MKSQTTLQVNAVTFGAVQRSALRLTEQVRDLLRQADKLEAELREMQTAERPDAPQRQPVAGPTSVGPQLLRLDAVIRRVGLSRSTVWKLIRDGKFPAPRRLGPRSVAWLVSDIESWIRTRPDSR